MTQLAFPSMPEQPARRMPVEPIVRAAEVDGPLRWTARRSWGHGPSVLWCGLNPSKADGKKDDPTMKRMIGFSYRWGFGSMVVVNWSPFITPDPKKLRDWLKTHESTEIMLANRLRVRDEIMKVDACVAAWGAGLSHDDIQSFMFDLVFTGGEIVINWKCLGVTELGAPKHPLARGRHRLPDNTMLVDWAFEFDDHGYGG